MVMISHCPGYFWDYRVGASELVAYPYWCLEKGYARAAGKRDNSIAWESVQGLVPACCNGMRGARWVFIRLPRLRFILTGATVLPGLA